jgi:hypothetical protein
MRRVFLGVVVVGLGAGLLYYLTRGGSDDAKADEAGPTAARNVVASKRLGSGAQAKADPGVHETPLPVDLSDVSPSVKKWKEPGLPGTFREIVAPDDSVNEEELLTYRTRRLRFQLTDAAAACYDGPDSKQQVALSYTLVVEDHELFVIDTRLLESNISDRTLENCIVNAVKMLRAPAPDVPDMQKKQETVISLHDLNARNRSVE